MFDLVLNAPRIILYTLTYKGLSTKLVKLPLLDPFSVPNLKMGAYT